VPRVCHLITRLILGGAQRLALETAVYAREQGWDVELWSGPQTGPEGTLHDEARARGLTPRIVPDLLREVSPLHDARAFFQLRQMLQVDRFDLIHTHSSKAGIVGRFAAVHAGVRVRLHSIHGWALPPATSALAGEVFTHLERRAAPHAHALIAVSEAVRDAGLARGIGRPEQYRVIRGGIRVPTARADAAKSSMRQALGLPPETVVLGTIGRLDHAKDPLGALAALAPHLRRQPHLRLLFIGDGPLRTRVERVLAAAGVESQVVLAGLRRDAVELARACDVFFLASRWEGFPLAVIEAMALGLPVVAYDVSGVREAVRDSSTGFLVPPGDGRQWAERLMLLASSREMRDRMGDAARTTACAQFSIERMLADTLRLYEELLA
jgi:glycosyltransferase involved in cell wall biosynthesis